MTDTTSQVTGLIPTVLAIGILKKTSDSFLGAPKTKTKIMVLRRK